MSDVLDYQAQHYLRKHIRRLQGDEYKQLKSLLFCNQTVQQRIGAVFVMADNDGHSAFYGHTSCKNPFCCPVCSSLMMEKYRERISAAIEILKPTHVGFMVTFTMPHLGFMGWRESMDILYQAHTYFRQRSYKRSHGHAMNDFHKIYPVQHTVKVCEFTWSKKNGAHPHFHCIWWIPRDKFDNGEILSWERTLNDFWLKTLKRKTLAYWKANDLHKDKLRDGETLEILVERLYGNGVLAQERVDGKGYALYFSKDSNGNIREAENGDYISGWGADNELTGNYRKAASHEGHMTPYQMLVESFHDDTLRDEYLKFCLAVTKKPVHHRVRFSFSGIAKRIDEYLKNKKERETKSLQKKSTWETVTYFDEEEWYQLCDLDDIYAPVLSNILWFAAQRRDLLADYLDSLGVKYHSDKHRSQSIIDCAYGLQA